MGILCLFDAGTWFWEGTPVENTSRYNPGARVLNLTDIGGDPVRCAGADGEGDAHLRPDRGAGHQRSRGNWRKVDRDIRGAHRAGG